MVDAWKGMEGRSKSNVKGSTALSHVTTQDAQIRCAALQVFKHFCKQCESCIQLRPIRMEQSPGA